MTPVVKIQRLWPDSPALPRYHSERAAAFDLVAYLHQTLTLEPGARAAIPTGIAMEIPPGFEGQVRARSGRALEEGLALVNSPGTIDSDYRGEIKVILINFGQRALMIEPGDRIAQMVIAPVAKAQLVEVDSLSSSGRGEGGFGHSGR